MTKILWNCTLLYILQVFVSNIFNKYLHCNSLAVSFLSNWSIFLLTLYRCPLVLFFSTHDCVVLTFCWLSNPNFKEHICAWASILLLIDSHLPRTDSNAKIRSLGMGAQCSSIPYILIKGCCAAHLSHSVLLCCLLTSCSDALFYICGFAFWEGRKIMYSSAL